MTTIAYRDGVLAADSLAVLNNATKLPGVSKKLWRLPDGSLAAGSGDAVEIAKVLDHASGVGSIKIGGYSGDAIITVTPSGVVRMHMKEHAIEMGSAPFFAIGSGASSALAAMHEGASAPEAIIAASKVDIYTDDKVQTITFEAVSSPSQNQPSHRNWWRRRLSEGMRRVRA